MTYEEYLLQLFSSGPYSLDDPGETTPLPDWVGKHCGDCPLFMHHRCMATGQRRGADDYTCAYFTDQHAGLSLMEKRLAAARNRRYPGAPR